jgi:hypothetical protein
MGVSGTVAVGCGRLDECIQDIGVSGAVAVGCGRRDVRAVYSMEGDSHFKMGTFTSQAEQMKQN